MPAKWGMQQHDQSPIGRAGVSQRADDLLVVEGRQQASDLVVDICTDEADDDDRLTYPPVRLKFAESVPPSGTE